MPSLSALARRDRWSGPRRARPTAALIERNAFTVRHFDVPVLAPGADPIRVLHVSDLHILARQTRKIDWIRGLARLAPDLVINTGDTFCSARLASPL